MKPTASTIQLKAGSLSPPPSWLPGIQQALPAFTELEFVELQSHTNPHDPAASLQDYHHDPTVTLMFTTFLSPQVPRPPTHTSIHTVHTIRP